MRSVAAVGAIVFALIAMRDIPHAGGEKPHVDGKRPSFFLYDACCAACVARSREGRMI